MMDEQTNDVNPAAEPSETPADDVQTEGGESETPATE